jgi:hypothetical protein
MDDFDIRDLNYEFVSQFAFWLKSERNCGHNAAVKYMGNLKKNRTGLSKERLAARRSIRRFKLNRKRSDPGGIN